LYFIPFALTWFTVREIAVDSASIRAWESVQCKKKFTKNANFLHSPLTPGRSQPTQTFLHSPEKYAITFCTHAHCKPGQADAEVQQVQLNYDKLNFKLMLHI
jgi:hypothetical protein